MLAVLSDTVTKATAAFEKFDYSQALQEAEQCFWYFCDSYVELSKGRSYDTSLGQSQISALATLNQCLKVFIRLFAPFVPYMTEELWSWAYTAESESVHRAHWPSIKEFDGLDISVGSIYLDVGAKLLSTVHSRKTSEHKSLGAPLDALTLKIPSDLFEAGKLVAQDIKRAAKLVDAEVEFVVTEDSVLTAELRFKELQV